MKQASGVRFLLLLFASLQLFSCATAPPPKQGVGNLSAEQLKALVDRKASVVLVDTRTEYEFKQGRIPGSINIPPHKFRVLGELLPADKKVHIIFYCRGAG